MMTDAAIDYVAAFSSYLTIVACCPQVEAALNVLIGQSSKYTKELALKDICKTLHLRVSANPGSRGATYMLNSCIKPHRRYLPG